MSASFLPRHDIGEGETFGISEGMCRRQRPEVLKQQENVNAANRLVSSKIFTLIPFEGLDASGIGPEGTSVTLRSKQLGICLCHQLMNLDLRSHGRHYFLS